MAVIGLGIKDTVCLDRPEHRLQSGIMLHNMGTLHELKIALWDRDVDRVDALTLRIMRIAAAEEDDKTLSAVEVGAWRTLLQALLLTCHSVYALQACELVLLMHVGIGTIALQISDLDIKTRIQRLRAAFNIVLYAGHRDEAAVNILHRARSAKLPLGNMMKTVRKETETNAFTDIIWGEIPDHIFANVVVRVSRDRSVRLMGEASDTAASEIESHVARIKSIERRIHARYSRTSDVAIPSGMLIRAGFEDVKGKKVATEADPRSAINKEIAAYMVRVDEQCKKDEDELRALRLCGGIRGEYRPVPRSTLKGIVDARVGLTNEPDGRENAARETLLDSIVRATLSRREMGSLRMEADMSNFIYENFPDGGRPEQQKMYMNSMLDLSRVVISMTTESACKKADLEALACALAGALSLEELWPRIHYMNNYNPVTRLRTEFCSGAYMGYNEDVWDVLPSAQTLVKPVIAVFGGSAYPIHLQEKGYTVEQACSMEVYLSDCVGELMNQQLLPDYGAMLFLASVVDAVSNHHEDLVAATSRECDRDFVLKDFRIKTLLETMHRSLNEEDMFNRRHVHHMMYGMGGPHVAVYDIHVAVKKDLDTRSRSSIRDMCNYSRWCTKHLHEEMDAILARSRSKEHVSAFRTEVKAEVRASQKELVEITMRGELENPLFPCGMGDAIMTRLAHASTMTTSTDALLNIVHVATDACWTARNIARYACFGSHVLLVTYNESPPDESMVRDAKADLIGIEVKPGERRKQRRLESGSRDVHTHYYGSSRYPLFSLEDHKKTHTVFFDTFPSPRATKPKKSKPKAVGKPAKATLTKATAAQRGSKPARTDDADDDGKVASEGAKAEWLGEARAMVKDIPGVDVTPSGRFRARARDCASGKSLNRTYATVDEAKAAIAAFHADNPATVRTTKRATTKPAVKAEEAAMNPAMTNTATTTNAATKVPTTKEADGARGRPQTK